MNLSDVKVDREIEVDARRRLKYLEQGFSWNLYDDVNEDVHLTNKTMTRD